MLDLTVHTQAFLDAAARGEVEFYNEFSLQHELGLFLRERLRPSYRVEFERPSTHFGIQERLTKREIDIAIIKPDHTEVYAIELKFPRSGAHPEQMFKCVEDIAFVEDLCARGFLAGAVLVLADDPLYHSAGSTDGIYGHFRAEVPLEGDVDKPTGQRNEIIRLRGVHVVRWTQIAESLFAALVPVAGSPHASPPSARRQVDNTLPPSAPISSAPRAAKRIAGKYAPLSEFLREDGRNRVEMSFSQIDAMVGGLPRSAREHQAWWANQVSGSQATAWMSAGFRVEMVDQVGQRVRFVRAR
jgi:hypothetical protein